MKAEDRSLEKGEQYRVTITAVSGQQVHNFDKAYQAVGFFKALGKPATLSIANGNELQPRVTVQDGQVVLLNKDFGEIFRTPDTTNLLDRAG